MSAILEDSYKQLTILMGDTEISTATLYSALRFAMEIVEFSGAEGHERKAMVHDLLKKLINEIGGGNEACLVLLDSDYFGYSIDLIVEASKGGLSLNKLPGGAASSAIGQLKKVFGCLCQ